MLLKGLFIINRNIYLMCKCHGRCGWSKIAWVLVVIGGINWGLVGVGQLIHSNLNVVNLLLSAWPTVEATVYLAVGVATICYWCGCKCRKCKDAEGNCMGCKVASDKPMSPGSAI